jgi:putative aldouronate transport system substrate-binding protein
VDAATHAASKESAVSTRAPHGILRRLRTLILVAFLFSLTPAALLAQGATPSADGAPDYTPFRFDEPVKITLFTAVRSREAGPPDDKWTWPERVKEDLNIEVEVQFASDPTQYTEMLRTRAAANDLPDVFQTDPSTTALLADQGLVGEWPPLFEYMPTYVRDRNVEELAPVGTIDGKQYGLVTQNPEPFKGVTAIRGDWLEALGLEVPTTTEEFLEVAKAFTEQDPDGNGQDDTWGFTGAPDFEGYITQFGGFEGSFGSQADWRIVDGELVNVAASQERREYLEFVHSLIEAGVVDPNWQSQEILDAEANFKSGRIGIVFTDWCLLFCVQGYSEFKGANPTGTWTIIDPPVGPDGESAQDGYSNVGPQYGISTKAIENGKGEAVARLLEWINGPGYVPTAFGEEGLNWEWKDGVRVQNAAVETIPYRQLVGWGYVGSPSELQTRYNSVTTYDDGETINVFEVLQRCQEYPIEDITQWAVLPPAPADSYADYVRTRTEGEFAFLNGSRSFDEWDDYVQSLYDNGLQDWTDQAEDKAKEVGLME